MQRQLTHLQDLEQIQAQLQQQQLDGGTQVQLLLAQIQQGLLDAFAVLQQLRAFHSYWAACLGGVLTAVGYAGAAFVALLFTAHRRVAAARPLLLLLILAAGAAEVALVFLQQFRLSETTPGKTENEDSLEAAGLTAAALAVRLICLVLCVRLWIRQMRSFCPPEEVVRRELSEFRRQVALKLSEVEQALKKGDGELRGGLDSQKVLRDLRERQEATDKQLPLREGQGARLQREPSCGRVSLERGQEEKQTSAEGGAGSCEERGGGWSPRPSVGILEPQRPREENLEEGSPPPPSLSSWSLGAVFRLCKWKRALKVPPPSSPPPSGKKPPERHASSSEEKKGGCARRPSTGSEGSFPGGTCGTQTQKSNACAKDALPLLDDASPSFQKSAKTRRCPASSLASRESGRLLRLRASLSLTRTERVQRPRLLRRLLLERKWRHPRAKSL